MLGRLLALATRLPRLTLAVLVVIAVAGGVVGVLVPVDGRLDRLAPSGSAAQRAGEEERTSFGGDTAIVVVRGDIVRAMRSADIVRLNGLEGCLAGATREDAKGPCAAVAKLNAVKSVQGPVTYVSTARVEMEATLQARVTAIGQASTEAQQAAEAAAKKGGASAADAKAAGEAAKRVTRVQGLSQLAEYAQDVGLGTKFQDASLLDKDFVSSVLFAKGADRKLGPKRRIAWLIPNRQTALIQVNLAGDLSASKRSEVTQALVDVINHPAFKLTASKATYEFTGLAPATQTLSDAIRRSALALGAAALLVMALVLGLARRLRRRLLPVLVAGTVVGGALMALALPVGALSLAVVVALPVLVGLAVDQAVQAQLRLERRLHSSALRTLVIAGAAASASALALVASPFAVVRTVGIALAGAILAAIVVAAVASAAAMTLGQKRAERRKDRRPPPVVRALHDADTLVAESRPVRAGVAAGHRISARASKMGRRPAVITLAIGLLIALAGAGLGSKASVETDLTSLVPADSSGARQLAKLREDIGTASTISLVVKTKQPGDPDLWRYLVGAQRSVTEGRSGRCDGENLCTPLPLDELFGTRPGGPLPTDKQVRDVLSVLPERVSRSLIDVDRGVIALPFGVGTLDGAKQRRLVAQLSGLAKAAPGENEASVSGLPAVVAASADALEAPGNRALLALLAIALPGLVLLATLRSVRRTVVALVPPAFALGWSELALWLLGVPRTPLTAALGVLVAAVAVEFSVLLSERYAALRRVGLPQDKAIVSTLRETGGAVVISAGATIAGFAVLGLASIPVISQFGIATAVDLALVLVALVAVGPATWVLADAEPVEATPPPRDRALATT